MLRINTKRWSLMVCTVLLTAVCFHEIRAQNEPVEDLHKLASKAADEEVKNTEKVLAEDEKKHGKEWLTRERLIAIAGAWILLQLIALLLVIRDLRGRACGWPAIFGWIFAIIVAGFLAGMLYWMWQKLGRKSE